MALWHSHLGDAHGMVAANWWTPEKRLSVFRWNRVQHLPLARGHGPAAGKNPQPRAIRARRAKPLSEFHVRRPLRYRSDASAITEGASRAGQRSRKALPVSRIQGGSRPGRAPVWPLREACFSFGRRSRNPTPAAVKTSLALALSSRSILTQVSEKA